MFDSDEDGLLSREELTKAAQMLHTIKVANAEDTAVEVKEEARSKPVADGVEDRRVEQAETEVVTLVLWSFLTYLAYISGQHSGRNCLVSNEKLQ